MRLLRRLSEKLDYQSVESDIVAARGARIYDSPYTDIHWIRHCLNKWRKRI